MASMKFMTVALLGLMLAGCIVPEPAVRPATYDLGNFSANASLPELKRPVLVVGEVQAPHQLDSTYIFYRLEFSNPQERKPYSQSRWAMPPAQLVQLRMKNRLSQVFSIVSASDAINAPLLRVELETFDQEFVSKSTSQGVIRLRASLIRNRQLLAQKSFASERPAPTADAPGGVAALTQATDAMLDELVVWAQSEMAGQP
jgi:cholesterol transport system auxiliary component